MELLCRFIITFAIYVQLHMVGAAYIPFTPGSYIQARAYLSSPVSQSSNALPAQYGYNNAGGGFYNSLQDYSADGSAANTVRNHNAGTQASGGPVLDIIVPQAADALEDFEYKPTKEGYRFSYTLTDGRKYEENGVLPRDELQDLVNMGTKKDSDSGSSRGPKKNRKLSPSSLKSLAG